MAAKRTPARVAGRLHRPHVRGSVLVAALVLASLSMAVPMVGAHHQGGVTDTDFETHYMVKGRVVNETGWPLADVQVNATLFQYGSSVWTDCGGEFEAAIQLHQEVSGSDRVHVTARLGNESRGHYIDANPVTRRSDTVVVVPGTVPNDCRTDNIVEVWEYRYTVAGRIVDERGPMPVTNKDVNITFHLVTPDGDPQKSTGRFRDGSLPKTDINGDFEYSIVVADESQGGYKITPETYGYIEVMVDTVGVIAELREPVFPGRYIYVNGAFGAVPIDNGGASGFVPGPGLLAAVAGAAVAAAAGARRRGGGRA